MAYSRTPEFNSHKIMSVSVGAPPNLGSAYSVKYKNCIPRNMKSSEGEKAFLEKRPSYIPSGKFMNDDTNTSVTYADVRGVFISNAANSSYFCMAIDDRVFINGSVRLTLGTALVGRYVGFTEAVVAGVHYIVVLETAGAAGYAVVHTINTSSWATASTTLTGIVTTGDPIFMNGRIYVAQYGTHRIYNSAVNSLTTWDTANDYIDAEQVGDMIYALGYHRNTLVAFGYSSIEFFKDEAIDIGSPLLRIENYSSGVGIHRGGVIYDFIPTFAYIGSSIFFLGVSQEGVGLFNISDFRITKIQNPVLEPLFVSNSRESRLFTVSVKGRLYIMISNGTSDCYIYDPIDKYTAEWSFVYTDDNDDVMFPSPKFVATAYALNNYSSPQKTYIFVEEYEAHSDPDLTVLAPEDNSPTELVQAILYIDHIDDGNNLLKHWKYVDIIGQTNYNTVELHYRLDDVEINFPEGTESIGADGHPTRFRNLGRGRKISMLLSFEGTNDISITRIDIAYNLGTH